MHTKIPNILSPRWMQGFSLIELMISIVLGALVVAAVGNVYLSSTRTFRTQDGMARMQEGARFAFETIGYDIRQMGFGCASVNATLDATWYKNLFARPLEGYNNGVGSPVAAVDVDNTDALRILRADAGRETTITAAGTTNVAHNMNPNGLVVITNDAYSDATIYVATAAAGTGYTLGAATPCVTGAPVPGAINNHLLPLSAFIYYIGTNPAGEPSLYRQALQSNGTVASEELVEGVENMQVEYGRDTTQVSVPDCPDDGCTADTFSNASAVTDWNRVVSVRVTFTMRSADNLATNTGGADSRLRRTFSTTIALRNRL